MVVSERRSRVKRDRKFARVARTSPSVSLPYEGREDPQQGLRVE
jgi:hypothetical protein